MCFSYGRVCQMFSSHETVFVKCVLSRLVMWSKCAFSHEGAGCVHSHGKVCQMCSLSFNNVIQIFWTCVCHLCSLAWNGVCQTYSHTWTLVFQMCSLSLNGCSMHNSGCQMCFLPLDNVCKIVENVSFFLIGVFHVAKFQLFSLANLQSGSIRNSDTDRQTGVCPPSNMPNRQHAK